MITPGRGHNGRWVRTPDTAQRDAAACRLRARGCSFQQIADQLGYTDKSLARRAVQRALDGIVVEDVEMLRMLEQDRLDEMHRVAWQVMEADHLLVDHGRVVRGPDGQPLQDWRPTLAAIDTLLKISTRRARLLGLDQPIKATVTTISEGDVDRAIAELAAELALRANEGDGQP